MASSKILDRFNQTMLIQYLWLLASLALALANTETLIISLPADFPPSSGQLKVTHPTIDLGNDNHRTQKFEVPVDERYAIELQNLKIGQSYMIKFCWTALNPVSIENANYKVVPHNTPFDGTIDGENARVFVELETKGFSYPAYTAKSIPLNVSVVNLKMNIPVDLYSTILYILITMIAVLLFNRRVPIYDRLRVLDLKQSLVE
ncbi:LAMI_0B01046g1_1 [Lachancea mirantina]|uniref:LAMI_0B01046g1_1 n=1 Tax=Lachancea mirantina TaxID=1230905 RepID=A0A1G4IT85_9SACH|nr:LAMI_0B01046g1_1 [Lachancea mirantina]